MLIINYQINFLINLYILFLCLNILLLKLGIGIFSLFNKHISIRRVKLKGLKDAMKAWNLALIRKRVIKICFLLLMNSFDFYFKLAQVYIMLQERLSFACKKQVNIAYLLASPYIIILWLYQVYFKFLSLFFTFQGILAKLKLAVSFIIAKVVNEIKQRIINALY